MDQEESGDTAVNSISGDALDPTLIDTSLQLASALRRLRIRCGNPSLRTLERWIPTERPDGYRNVALSRTTVSGVLTGDRFPTHDYMLSFLDALGVPQQDQQPWLDAWVRSAEARRGSAGPSAGPEVPTAAPLTAPTRHAGRPYWMAGGAAMAAAAVGIGVVLTGSQGPTLTGSIGCEPPTCAATAPALTVLGRMQGPLPPAHDAVIMIQVDSTKRWYVGPRVVPDNGMWSRQIGVGNPVPQPRDRQFMVCLEVLPTTSVDQLSQQMQANAGEGLPTTAFPVDRVQLGCTRATRIQNT